MLSVKNVTKQFHQTMAVDDVSFEIKSGEIFSLIGPNGSGKTTIIKMIAGLLQPTKGSITVNEHDIVKDPIKAKSVVGYIPDEPAVWPAMTGEEFLHLSGSLYGVDEDARGKRMHELLSKFHLEGIEHGYFEDYSRGNKQKYTIVAALLHNPKLLLIDEPIVGLDPVSAEVATEMFADFTQEGGSVLLVTHTLYVAQKIARRVGVLKEGKLVTTGTMDELRQQGNLDAQASLDDVYKALTK